MAQSVLGVPEIGELFVNESARRGGRVTDMFADEHRLFARSVLGMRTEVRVGDTVEAGVAVRVSRTRVSVRPYLFRLQCENGAILASSDEAVEVDLAHAGDEDEQRLQFQAAVACCASQRAFDNGAAGMRAVATSRADTALTVMSMLVRHLHDVPSTALLDIMENFRMEPDRGAYGIMNAVTSVARQTRDPEHRWRLEEIGGGVPAMLLWAPKARTGDAEWPAARTGAPEREMAKLL